jgi:hypothetical protein
MEIKGVGGPSGSTGLTKTLKKEDNTSFREVLQGRIAQTTPITPTGGADSGPAFITRSEKLLGLLDGFAQALADPRKSLKEMAPLVQRMEGELRDLDTLPGAEKGKNQDLSRLAGEVSLLAHVTLFKFHRGDFV